METPLSKLARIVCACLLAATLLPASALAAPADGDSGPAAAASSSGARASQPLVKVADPSTANSWMDIFDVQDAAGGPAYSTEESGRLWVDKSVYASAADAEAAGLAGATLENPDRNFLVSLSTMSSASTVRAEQVNPHDIVFVIPLGSTLDSLTYDGKTHAEHLADALNSAIGHLMEAEAKNGENRVAVIGYNLHTTVMLPLDTYAPDAEGRYVKFVRGLTGGGNGLAIAATPKTPGIQTADGRFASYSYPQLALHTAGGAAGGGRRAVHREHPARARPRVHGHHHRHYGKHKHREPARVHRREPPRPTAFWARFPATTTWWASAPTPRWPSCSPCRTRPRAQTSPTNPPAKA